MMGSVLPETCWAIKKHWNNKFYCMVASCWFFLWVLYYDVWIHEHQVNVLNLNYYTLIHIPNFTFTFNVRLRNVQSTFHYITFIVLLSLAILIKFLIKFEFHRDAPCWNVFDGDWKQTLPRHQAKCWPDKRQVD
jgi:hypothetical protein